MAEWPANLRCDLCGGREFTPWAEDTRCPECANCHHVCAHRGSPMNTTEAKP